MKRAKKMFLGYTINRSDFYYGSNNKKNKKTGKI